MVIFIVGVILAAAVATTYLALGARDFKRIRHEVNRDTQPTEAAVESTIDPGRETIGFAWRALGGVIASVTLLYAVSHVWWSWYAFPALAIGTGVAVSVAFVIDPTRTSP
jgi:uncharacterized membrane protein